MKIIHLGDLHIGKKVNGFSMIEDQKYILDKIIGICKKEKIEVAIIAGDVYDKLVPTPEAVELLDRFLVALSNENITVLMISGNHDSQERLAFGEKLLEKSGIHISPIFKGSIEEIRIGENVSFYLLPYIKPIHVRKAYEIACDTYNCAVKEVVNRIEIDEKRVNILITHQFITGAVTCDSEELVLGGIDNVGADVFEKFDYVALGHIHRAQKICKETIRYSGSPLKYSFSECNHKKSVTILEVGKNKEIEISQKGLVPIRDLRQIKGKYNDIMKKENYEGTNQEDYVHITLLDEDDILDVISKLRVIYPNIMKIEYDNKRTRQNNKIDADEEIENKIQKPIEIFKEFYEIQNNNTLEEEKEKVVENLINEIWGEM